jgi:lauroyl/myristoyl acyltransferase
MNFADDVLGPLRRGRDALRTKISRSSADITLRDVYEILRLTMQGLMAWTFPEAMWRFLTRPLGRLYVVTHRAGRREQAAQMAALLGVSHRTTDIYQLVVENQTNRYEERFQYLRAWRPGGWAPPIDIAGAEHVSAALRKGQGVVLWGGNFAFNDLVAKMAMHRLGLEVVGFSVPLHGISNTPFGMRVLNRVYRDIENRYLQERLMVRWKQIPSALQRLRDTLQAGGVVYFTVGGRGKRTATAKFLEGQIIIATGPVAMAHQMAAALLPLQTFRIGPGRFNVTIGRRIEIPQNQDGKPDCDAAVQAYADALAPFVLRDLGQWRGWHLIQKREPWGKRERRT